MSLATVGRRMLMATLRGIRGILVGPTVITTSTAATATAYSNQRKVDRCQNGVLWAMFWDGTTTTTTSMDFYYSTDNGATWTKGSEFGFGGINANGHPQASFFIDIDDYAHVVYKDAHFTDRLYYLRGTPNAARTAWTWTSPVLVWTSAQAGYLDLVAHREGTGWKVHIVSSWNDGSSNNFVHYHRVGVSSGGAFTIEVEVAQISANYAIAEHTFPSVDFNHTGDGKTVAGGTPHLYVGWSAGVAGAGKGIRFRKATFSAGAWTWGTEREIDSTRYIPSNAYWLLCLFDGTRVVLVGFLSTEDIIIYERDVADTTTTTRLLVDNATAGFWLAEGSFSYDANGNLYLLGRSGSANSALHYRKWTRSTATFETAVVVDSAAGNQPFVSAKRGYSSSRIEFIYTDGTASPYSVTYGGIK